MEKRIFVLVVCLLVLSGLSFIPRKSTERVSATNEGEIAIYRNSTSDTTTSTSFTGVNFDVQQRQDSIYTQNANDIDVELGVSGRYLFGYTIQIVGSIPPADRSSFLGRVTLNGTEQLSGHAQGFRRNSGNRWSYMYGFGTIDATAGDDIRVEYQKIDTNSVATAYEPDRSSFWLMRLNDSWDHIILQAEDDQTTSTSKQTVNFDNEIANTDEFIFTNNNTSITLKQDGHYLAIYSLGLDGANERTSVTSNLVLDIDETLVDIPQSYDYTYIRGLEGMTQGAVTNMSVFSASANDILSLEWGATGATSAENTSITSASSTLEVIRLPDTGVDYLIVHEAGGGQDIGGVNATVLFDTQDEADSGSFSYNTSTGVATINDTDDYLFTFGSRTNRAGTNLVRILTAGAFHIDGTRQNVGNTGVYIRGDGTLDGGMSAAGIFSLTSGEDIDFRINDSGDNGDDDSFVADSYGMTAINLTTLFTAGSNSLPVASGVNIENSASSFTLTENTTTELDCVGTVTDANGFADITSVQADFYRTSIGTGGGGDANNYYQSVGDSECVPSGGSGNSETYTCTFNIEYYADPTDSGSPNSSDDWTCLMTPSDTVGSGTTDSDTIEINSLTALDVTSSISYGNLDPNTDTGLTNQVTTITNTGNRDMDPELHGKNLTNGPDLIHVSNQRYSDTAFTYPTGSTALLGIQNPATINLTLPQRTGTVVTDDLFWGIGVPDGTPVGTYTGTNTFTAVSGL
jgi:hypothetical protein